MTTNMQGSHEATLKQSAIRKKLWGRGACFHGERRRETRRKIFGRRSAKMEQSLQNPVHRRRAWVQNQCCTINEGGVRE